jgi:hypothetical protein
MTHMTRRRQKIAEDFLRSVPIGRIIAAAAQECECSKGWRKRTTRVTKSLTGLNLKHVVHQHPLDRGIWNAG